jgi:hypothetical protein
MSLYITNNLNSRTAAKNYSALTFRRDGFYTAGDYFEGVISVDNGYADGEEIELIIGTITVTLNIVGTGFTLPTDIPAWAISNSAYAATFAEYLRKIPVLDELFVIEKIQTTTSTIGYVKLRARKPGTEYNIAWGAGSSFATELTIVKTGVDVVALENYQLNLEVQNLINGKWTVVYQATADPLPDFESNGAEITFYDVAAVIMPYLNHEAITDVYQAKIQHSLFSKVRVYYYESFGGADYHKTAISNSNLTLLLMALGMAHSDANTRLEAYHYSSSLHYFLTNAQRTKYITRAQPDFLTFIKRGTLASFIVRAYFSDNTDSSYTYSFSSVYGLSPADNDVVLIPSGFKNLRLELNETSSKKVVRYTVTLNTGSVAASEVFTYVMDERYFSDELYFLFYNSLGGLDSIRFTGYEVSSAETMYDETSVAIDGASTKAIGLFGQSGKSLRRKWKYNSGWNEAFEQSFLNEFFATENVWKVERVPDYSATVQQRTLLEKVVVQNKKLELIDREQYVYEAEFDVMSASEDIGLSDAVPDVDTADFSVISRFEFNNPDEDPHNIQFITSGINQRLYVNGVLYAAGNDDTNFSYSLAAATKAVFELKAKNNTLHIINASSDFLEAKVLYLNTNVISSLTIRFFGKVYTDWFVGRIRDWYSLSIFRINTVETEYEVDLMLHECAAQKLNGGAIVDVELTGSSPAPSAFGDESVLYLLANTVAVVTN